MLFNKSYINSLELQNKVFRSATHEGLADENGFSTKELESLYVNLVKGDVGCIITGYVGVMQNGKSSLKNMLMIDNDDKIPAYKNLTDKVHSYKGKIIVQLAHCGAQTSQNITKSPLISPSGKNDLAFPNEESKEMTEEDIEELINNFVLAGIRAKKSGFDGIQIHIAHGYLLCQFISPYTNIRTDKWGGNTNNRFRIIKEIFTRLRKELGDSYPIIAKLNIEDQRENGLRYKESLEIAKMLEENSCDAIELSCGVVEDGFYLARGRVPMRAIEYFTKGSINFETKDILNTAEKLYNLEKAKFIKENINIPVILVGGIRDKEDMEKALEDGMDYISLSRALICENDLIYKYKNNIAETSKCISCNYCIVGAEKNTLKCYRACI